MRTNKREEPSGIYQEIKERLAACKNPSDYEEAYKWLARNFIEINESARQFEEKVLAHYGERGLGLVMYGSEEAYDKEKALDEALHNASAEERGLLFMEKVLSATEVDTPADPELWPEDFEQE